MNPLLFIVFIFIALLLVAIAIIEVHVKPAIKHVILGLVTMIFGLMVGSLLAEPLSKLPGMFGQYLPISVSIFLGAVGLVFYKKLIPIVDDSFKNISGLLNSVILQPLKSGQQKSKNFDSVVVDSSVLIDRRVVDIAKAGFLPQVLLVPRFVIKEIQNIADSKDNDRREKGHRGLDSVNDLKKIKQKTFEITTEEFKDIPEVDHKLIALAKKKNASLLTTDFNLNKVATSEGISVLNINELAQSMRPDLLPGQELIVKVIHHGKDKTQGVGYLEDGTMIVIEQGGNSLNKQLRVRITRALQTTAGKMYFAKVLND